MKMKQIIERAESLRYGSGDFIDMQEMFEKTYKGKAWPFAYGHKLDRVSRDDRDSGKIPKNRFYNDETVNDWFRIYMAGYAFGITM